MKRARGGAIRVGRRLLPVVGLLPLLAACAMAVNTYSYSLVSAIPLVQSDVWQYLDGWLGRYLEHGFSLLDLFAQDEYGATNQPLQKLIVLFHTHFYGMDFRIEGAIGTLAGIALVLLLARAASSASVGAWSAREYWLVAALSFGLLSLNSTNVYTWPLATLWFVPILIASGYMWLLMARPALRWVPALATFLLGVLLDEVAYPVFISVLLALAVVRSEDRASAVRRMLLYGGGGLAASRLFYWAVSLASPARELGAGAEAAKLHGVLQPDAWKAAFIPLGDSVLHQANLATLFEQPLTAGAWVAVAVILLLAHCWFWSRILLPRRADSAPAATVAVRIAASVMLLFYGLIAGIVLQRVPEFGFDYLHQPRYVLFYELNLAALAIMAYAEYRALRDGLARRIAAGLLVVLISAFGLLQWRLSSMAWEHTKYLSQYLVAAAKTMGEVAADPDGARECPDIMTVCKFSPAKKREIMARLVRYRLNIFSPEFQAFHRLSPTVEPATAARDSDNGEATR